MSEKSIFNSTIWNFSPKKLAVLIPCRDQVYSMFSYCLAELVKTNTLAGIDTRVIMDASTILLNQREKLAAAAVDLKVDYMLWLDSDMVFPNTTALRLMAHDTPIVAANYMKRGAPLTTVAYPDYDWDNWLPLENSGELQEVRGVGMGCMMVKTSVFTELSKPWFAFTYQESTNDWMGEDFYVQRKMQEAGHKIYIDMNLSRQIRHIGNWAFGPSIATNDQQIVKRSLLNAKR